MPKKPLPQLGFVLRSGSEAEFAASRTRVSKVPAALFDWAHISAQLFWEDHRRCIAFLLFYNPFETNWTIELPKQQCTREGCLWSIAQEDLPQADKSCFLAGSLQTFDQEPSEAIEHLVPPFAGMHFLCAAGPKAAVLAFIRERSGACTKVEVNQLVLDNRSLMLNENRRRLTLV